MEAQPLSGLNVKSMCAWAALIPTAAIVPSGVLMLMVQSVARALYESGEVDSKRFLEILNRTIFKNVARMKSGKHLTLDFDYYDNNKMTMTWPSCQVMDVGAAMKQVQKYFVDGSAADLRRQFEIDDRQTGEKPGVYHVLMVPRQKRIREALDKLELWVDQKSSLMQSMRMTFANGDTKTMTFENVTPNAPLPPGIFTLDR